MLSPAIDKERPTGTQGVHPADANRSFVEGESLWLSHREDRFKARLKSRPDALASNFRRLIRINRDLGFFATRCNYFIQIIPAIIIGPMFIIGQVEFGVITQSTMAFATLPGAFSLIVTRFQSISAFAAVTSRLQMLSEAIAKNHHTTPWPILVEETPQRVSHENVTLASSDNPPSKLILMKTAIHMIDPLLGPRKRRTKQGDHRTAGSQESPHSGNPVQPLLKTQGTPPCITTCPQKDYRPARDGRSTSLEPQPSRSFSIAALRPAPGPVQKGRNPSKGI